MSCETKVGMRSGNWEIGQQIAECGRGREEATRSGGALEVTVNGAEGRRWRGTWTLHQGTGSIRNNNARH